MLRLRGFVPTNSGVGAVGAPLDGRPRHSALFEIEYLFGLNAHCSVSPPVVERMDAFTSVMSR